VARLRDHKILAATGAFAGYTAVMTVLERRMRATGGPGIIPFELAGSGFRAEQIMAQWGRDGQRAARTSTWLDFGYMTTYGALTALLIDRARRRRGHPRALMSLAAVAVAGDAVEGVSLLQVLDRRQVDRYARRARGAALVKFAALAGALGYVVADAARPS
jgi:GNAT superfamily N-acetyltransferase